MQVKGRPARSVMWKYLFWLPVLAAGCQSAYVANPPWAVRGLPDGPAVAGGGEAGWAAVERLFLREHPYTITLREADPDTGQPRGVSDGISANGLGGLFLPLVLDVDGLEVATAERRGDTLHFVSAVEAEVNGIAARCCPQRGRVTVDANDGIDVFVPRFYCNWVVIGNVLTGLKLSVDHIDLNSNTFTGYYEMSFLGTGNAFGTGYYRARIEPVPDVAAP